MAATSLEVTSGAEIAAGSRAQRPPVLYVLWGLFWLLMFAVAIQDYRHSGGRLWWQPLLWEGTSALMATFWLVLQHRAEPRYQAHLDRPLVWFGHHLKWLPLAAVTFVASVYAIRHGVYTLVGMRYIHEPWPQVFFYETLKLVLFFSLWLGIIFAFNSFAQYQERGRRLLSLQKSLAEAQLSQLKAQLRPHFLFNALNTISALMQVDVARADRLLARLGDLLRASLQAGEQNMTSLHEELRLVELYAQIMQERFEDRVALAWHIAPETANVSIPAMLLQPLLENAFKHGVERSSGRVQIEVESQRQGDKLRILVRNTPAALARDHQEGVGTRNCRERLQVIYGAAASMTLQQDGDSVLACVVLPWTERAA
jgi:two-component system, LytTR family, sensor kinase